MTIILETIFSFCVEQGTQFTFQNLVKTERGQKLLKKFNLHQLPDANDFEKMYQFAFLEFMYGKENNAGTKTLVHILSDNGLQQAFEQSFQDGDNVAIGRCLDAIFEASTETQEVSGIKRIDAQREVAQFRAIFEKVVRKTRPLHDVLCEQKSEANKEDLKAELQEIKDLINSRFSQQTEFKSQQDNAHIPLSANARYYQELARLENLLAQNPSDVDTLFEKAVLHYDHDDLDKALATINHAWELNNTAINIVNARACIITDYACRNSNPSHRLLREAIELFESLRSYVHTDTLDYNIGNAYSGMDNHSKAIEHFKAALTDKTEANLRSQIFTNMGNCYVALGDEIAALNAFQSALTHNPNRWEALSSWGEYEIQRKNYQQAVILFNRLIAVHPDIAEYSERHCYALGFAFWHVNEFENALSWVNKVLRIRPDHTDAHLLKAHLLADLWREGRYIFGAIKFFEDWRIDEPDNLFAAHILHLIYSSEGYRDKAQLIIEQTVKAEDVPPFVCVDYALFLKDEGKTQEAIDWLELALKHSQEHVIVHTLANLKFNLGQYEEAITYYQLAADDEQPIGIVERIADCFHLLGKHKMSLLMMAKAILIEPSNPHWWNNYIAAWQLLGKQKYGHNVLLHQMQNGQQLSSDDIQTHIDLMLHNLTGEFGMSFVEQVKSNKLISDNM